MPPKLPSPSASSAALCGYLLAKATRSKSVLRDIERGRDILQSEFFQKNVVPMRDPPDMEELKKALDEGVAFLSTLAVVARAYVSQEKEAAG